MQFIILFFIFLSSSLLANCSPQNIEHSDQLYEQANQEANFTKQIGLLEQSLKACYAPEIDASLLMIKIETTNNIYQKIAYYKELLGVIDNFENREEAFTIQNRCNLKLSQLYKPIDQEVSNIYRSKVYDLNHKEKSSFKYDVFVFFFLLLLWGFWGIFRKN